MAGRPKGKKSVVIEPIEVKERGGNQAHDGEISIHRKDVHTTPLGCFEQFQGNARNGTEGYRGCENGVRRQVEGYLFGLYSTRSERRDSAGEAILSGCSQLADSF